MSTKKTRRPRKTIQMKAAKSHRLVTPHRRGFGGSVEDATSSVTRVVQGIPANTLYWGIGALALGAAAVGAYMYRDRLISLYEDAMEAMDFDVSSERESSGVEMDGEMTKGSSRKSKGSSTQNIVETH